MLDAEKGSPLRDPSHERLAEEPDNQSGADSPVSLGTSDMMEVDATHRGGLPNMVFVDDDDSSRSDASVSSVLASPGLDASTVAGDDPGKGGSVASRQDGPGEEGPQSPTCKMTKCQQNAKRLSKLSKENVQLKQATLKFDPNVFELNRKVREQERDVKELKEDVARLIKRMQANLEDLISLKAKASAIFTHLLIPDSDLCHHMFFFFSWCEAPRTMLPVLSFGCVCLDRP